MVDENKKVQSLISYLLLWFSVKSNSGCKKPPELIFGKNNKPYLKNEDIFFNISHSKDGIACILSQNEVGIDIEKIRPVSQALAKKICTNEEYFSYCSSSNRNETLLTIWTKKESFVKMNANSIFTNFKKINTKNLKNVHCFKFENFIVSASLKNNNHIHKTKLPNDFFYSLLP